MAASGSVNFSPTRNDIIKGALRLCLAVAQGEEPEADEVVEASQALNMMAKELQADGLKLWKIDEGAVFMAADTSSYSLGPTGDHATLNYVTTNLAAAVAESGTALTVDSITGISASDNIGIELDDGTLHWDTVDGSPSGSAVALTTGVASAAADGNRLFTYTTKIVRPIRIMDARLKVNAGNEIPFTEWMSRDEYYDLPLKSSDGSPLQGYYDPQLVNGVLHIWPQAENVRDVVLFTFAREIEDFDAASDTPDFPPEWMAALKFGLAVEIGPEYDVPLDRLAWLARERDRKFAFLDAADIEEASIRFEPTTGES